MSEYILILLIHATGGNVSTSILFPTKEACENAGEMMKSSLGVTPPPRYPSYTSEQQWTPNGTVSIYSYVVRALCVPRNTP